MVDDPKDPDPQPKPEDAPLVEPEPTPPPAPDPLADMRRQNEALSEQLRQAQEQGSALSERLKKLETPPPPSQEESTKKFYADPVGETRGIIRQELQETVAPLLDFVREFKGNNKYDQLKNKWRRDARFTAIFDSYEAYIDRALQNIEPTDAAMLSVLTSIAGSVSLGLISSGQPAPGGNPVPVTPPHIRPSPPPAPKPQKKERIISEEQRRLMRENGMTEDEYFEHYDTDRMVISPEEIVAPKGGKK